MENDTMREEKILQENEFCTVTSILGNKTNNVQVLTVRVWDKKRKKIIRFDVNSFYDKTIKGIDISMTY